MKQNLRVAVLMVMVTTILFGLIYPLVVTGLGKDVDGGGHLRRVTEGSARSF